MGNTNCDTCGHDKRMCECGDPDIKASERQVGGSHYRSEYQHWDWSIDIRLGYLESAATKYFTRWRGKNGVQDVEKGIHYLEKIKEAFCEGRLENRSMYNDGNAKQTDKAMRLTRKFLKANSVPYEDWHLFEIVAMWRHIDHLSSAISAARQLLQRAQRQAEQPQEAAGRAGGRVGQAMVSSASTGRSEQSALGMEHPFGYDAEAEG